MADPVVVVVPKKPVWKSKTFWANLLAGIAVYTGYLPAQTAAYVVPIINILLRFVTQEAVTLTGK